MGIMEYNALNRGDTLTNTADWSKKCHSKGIGFCFAIGQPNLDSYILNNNRGVGILMCVGFKVSLSYALKHLHFYVATYSNQRTLLECSVTEYNKKDFKIFSVKRI